MSKVTLDSGLSEYDAWLKDELVLEGGKVDDPKDPGGRTNKGVTQRVYNGYRRVKSLPLRDVWLIGDAEVAEIYRSLYWDKIHGDDLPIGLAGCVGDGAVNSGVVQATKWLQAGLGVRVDGVVGPATLAAAQACVDVDKLIGRICDARLVFCKHLRTWSRFGKGWSARIAHVEAAGQAVAMGTVGPAVQYVQDGERKALIEDARNAPPKSLGDATGVGGVVGVALTQTQGALAPVAQVEWIGHTLTAITVLMGLAAVVGFIYSAWARKEESARNAALMLVPDSRPADPVPVNDNAPASVTVAPDPAAVPIDPAKAA